MLSFHPFHLLTPFLVPFFSHIQFFFQSSIQPTVHRRKRWEGCAKNTQSNHSISYRGTRLGDQKEREMKKRKKRGKKSRDFKEEKRKKERNKNQRPKF